MRELWDALPEIVHLRGEWTAEGVLIGFAFAIALSFVCDVLDRVYERRKARRRKQ